MIEHEHQVLVIDWAREHENRWPDLWFLFAIANAGAGAQKGQAGKMKAEGVKPGVPDLCLPVARGEFHGLFIEMKTETSGPSKEQRIWLERLVEQGYYCAIAQGSAIAIQILQTYVEMSRTGPSRWIRCRLAASILPIKQCILEEGHEGSCMPDNRPRIPRA